MCNKASESCDTLRPDCWSVSQFFDDLEAAEGAPDRRKVAPSAVPPHLMRNSHGTAQKEPRKKKTAVPESIDALYHADFIL